MKLILRLGSVSAALFCQFIPFVAITARGPITASPSSIGAHVRSFPLYAQQTSAQRITGSDFLSITTGWIAVSRSSAYVPNGKCTHGLGSHCGTARTIIYGTADGGAQWRRLLTLTTTAQQLVWIRFFNVREGLVAADIGLRQRGELFSTSDGGRTWRRALLATRYFATPATITFPDPSHGWIYVAGGIGGGNMDTTIFGTVDGGKHWSRVACSTEPVVPQTCHPYSGITFFGDKQILTFANDRDGWLTIFSITGIPALLHSTNGGHTWHDQRVGLPPRVRTFNRTSAMGTFDRPHIFGLTGVLAEPVQFLRTKSDTSWSRLVLYRSEDAGAHWHFYQLTPVTAPSGAAYGSDEGSLAQYLNERLWFVVSGNVMWHTANAGKEWSYVTMHLPATLDLVSFTFVDSLHGWAEAVPACQSDCMLGSTTVLRTRDGGGHWQRVGVP